METRRLSFGFPERICFVRVFLLVMLGPAAVFSTLMLKQCPGIDFDDTTACAVIGAIWGLAFGVLRQSLLRTILGLNIGAALGNALAHFVIENGANDLMCVIALALAGSAMGAAMNARWKTFSDSAMQGAISGFASFGLMGSLFFVFLCAIEKYQRVSEIIPISLVGIALMAGLGLFLWLIVDHGDAELDGSKPLERLRPQFRRWRNSRAH